MARSRVRVLDVHLTVAAHARADQRAEGAWTASAAWMARSWPWRWRKLLRNLPGTRGIEAAWKPAQAGRQISGRCRCLVKTWGLQRGGNSHLVWAGDRLQTAAWGPGCGQGWWVRWSIGPAATGLVRAGVDSGGLPGQVLLACHAPQGTKRLG